MLTFWGLPAATVLISSVAAALTAIAVLLAVPPRTGRLRRLTRLARSAGAQPSNGRRERTVTRAGEVSSPRGLVRAVAAAVRPRPDAWPRATRAVTGLVVGGGVAGLCILGGLRSGPGVLVLGLLGGLACFVVTGRLEPAAARQRRLRMVTELPHTLELLAAALQAGLALRSAVARVGPLVGGPLGQDLGQVLRRIELGVPEPDAWRSLRDHTILGHLALDLARSVDSGTMLASTLRHHARESRRNRRGALEARARSVGVHSVPPLMVCFLPAFLLIGVVPTGVTAFLHALG